MKVDGFDKIRYFVLLRVEWIANGEGNTESVAIYLQKRDCGQTHVNRHAHCTSVTQKCVSKQKPLCCVKDSMTHVT